MPRLTKQALLDRLTRDLLVGGWNYLITSRQHPFELLIYRGGESYRARIYIWNVTHGGASRDPSEYRIQITSGVTQFSTASVNRTLVLGWWDSGGVYAGWDVSKHLQPLGASPSLQIHEDTLRRAAVDRLATYRKENDEIAVAFASSFLGEYVAQVPDLHAMADSDNDLAALANVIADPEQSDAAIAGAGTGARRMVLRQVAQQLRDIGFADRVLTAYAHSCAMCGVQLRVIDAAHILPAAYIDDDSTSNGIALCGTHHRAFDRSLVTFKSDFSVVINPLKMEALRQNALDGGLARFRSGLLAQIILPPNTRDRPNHTRIRDANTLRGWTRYEPIVR